jgi:hypothetical protein
MKLLRVLVVAAATTGLLLPLGPVSGTSAAGGQPVRAKALARLNTRVTIHPFYHHQKYRHRFPISGQVRYYSGGNVYAKAGATVTLLRRPAGSSNWSRIGRDKTSHTTKPTYAFSVLARGNASYRVRFAGTRRLQPSRAQARVLVHRRVPSHLRHPRPDVVKLVGHVEPAWRHRHVRLVKRSCRSCSWHVVRQHRTNGRSHFRFGLRAPRSGSWYFRVRVPGTSRFAPSISATYRTYS